MSITEKGIAGEKKARNFLKHYGIKLFEQIDWMFKSGDKWYAMEVKQKEIFTKGGGCPFDGQGLNISQIELRNKLLEDKGIRTFFLVFSEDDGVTYGQFLDILNAKKENYFDTKNGIRIFNLNLFNQYGSIKNYADT